METRSAEDEKEAASQVGASCKACIRAHILTILVGCNSHNCFPEIIAPSEYGLHADVIHWSLVQNEVLFSSEGLTLLAPDHVYAFKSALASYSTTQAPPRLEDAVNELRRLVLVQAGRKLSMRTLTSRYTWLGPITGLALDEVRRMYRRAYGGASGEGGIDVDVDVMVQNEQSSKNPKVDAEWPLPSYPICIIGSTAQYEALPQGPPKTSPSPIPSEDAGAPTWYTQDSQSTVAESSLRDKRFAKLDGEFRFGLDFEELSHARDLLTEREEAETAAWLSGRSSGEAVDFADRLFLDDIAELGRKNNSPPVTPVTQGKGVIPFTIDVDQGLQERTVPMVTEKPRLHLETSPSPLLLVKPVALRAAPALKLQTSFDPSKALKSRTSAAPHRSFPPSRSMTDDTLSLIGMTPIEVRMPGFDRFFTNDEEAEEEELTARPTNSGHPDRQQGWTRRWDGLGGGSIEGRLASPEVKGVDMEGPMTPNGYDDISPVTRGEWGFLFQGDTWVKGRCVQVETC